MDRILPFAVAAATLWLTAGCGTLGTGGDMAAEPTARTGATADRPTELTIVLRHAAGKGGERTFTLVCDPPGGDHPDPTAACRLLSELEEPFAPVPPDTLCTEVYGGPRTATVTGLFRGDPVHAEFSRTDGCQIARWDKHAALLGGAGVEDR